jgi:hypothetical protein
MTDSNFIAILKSSKRASAIQKKKIPTIRKIMGDRITTGVIQTKILLRPKSSRVNIKKIEKKSFRISIEVNCST